MLKKEKNRKRKDDTSKVRPADAPYARNIRKYEFHVVGDPDIYRLPHAIVSACWELGDHGLRVDKLSVPKPRLYPQRHEASPLNKTVFTVVPALWKAMNNQQRFVAILGVVFVTLALLFFILLPSLNFIIALQVGKPGKYTE